MKRRAASQKPGASLVVTENAVPDENEQNKKTVRRRKSKTTEDVPNETGAEASTSTARRKSGKEPKTPTEKRTDRSGRAVRFLTSPNQATRERIERALPGSGHRLYLISSDDAATPSGVDGPARKFAVLGATGNVYHVNVSRHPSCTCPDFTRRGAVCKHMLFVMIRVLRRSAEDPLVWQKALLASEVETLLSSARPEALDTSVLAAERVRERYEGLAKASTSDSQGGVDTSVQRPVAGDCPICFDPMEAGGDAVTFCATCGNNVHASCFANWRGEKKRSAVAVTCVYCRAPWEADKKAADANQYVNLAAYSGQAPDSTTLEDLYGDRAALIRGQQGEIPMRRALNMFNASQGRR